MATGPGGDEGVRKLLLREEAGLALEEAAHEAGIHWRHWQEVEPGGAPESVPIARALLRGGDAPARAASVD